MPSRRPKHDVTRRYGNWHPSKSFGVSVSGPYRVGTVGKGYRWIVTFTDHASDFFTVYLLHHKSEVFKKFSERKAYAERQTGRMMKRIMSDRGGEYLTDKLKQLTVREGIVHQILQCILFPSEHAGTERDRDYYYHP
jgi:hypothetical protein